MKTFDKNYLSLQFRNKIHTKNGIEFQSFFESIMEKAFHDFQKIKLYGKEGDGGNDGYRKNLGIYYQVYAPNNPFIKDSEAGKKFLDDFEKLEKNWNSISEIKAYFLVFNDKYLGLPQRLEKTTAQLENNNPHIKFEVITSKKLEEIFFTLDETDMLNLGFSIDSREAITIAYESLEGVEVALDREDPVFAFNLLKSIRSFIMSLEDDKLEFEIELLEGRCLEKKEQIAEAKKIYENMARRNPYDPRPVLYLAEIYLREKNYNKNKELLEGADTNYWLTIIEILLRKNSLGEKIDISGIDEKSFPNDFRVRSNFYRIYSIFLESSNPKLADSFIEKAIHCNPNKLINYELKFSYIEKKLFSKIKLKDKVKVETEKFLRQIEEVEKKFYEYGDMRDRVKSSLWLKKANAYRILEKYSEHKNLIEQTFCLNLDCYFDKNIEQNLIFILWQIFIPKTFLTNLLQYLANTEVELADDLLKMLIIQFNYNDCLVSEGKEFYKEKKQQKYLSFIDDIENRNYDNIVLFLKDDTNYAVNFIDSITNAPELRLKIIDSIPNEESVLKDRLLLLTYCGDQNYDKAFEILKKIDLSSLQYLECKHVLRIIEKKDAWDLQIIIIEKLLQHEKNSQNRLNLKLMLFKAFYNLENYLMAIKIGNEILENDEMRSLLSERNKEVLLGQTISAYLKRGSEKNAYNILSRYLYFYRSPEFKFSIETDVYLKNNLPTNALKSIIDAAKIKKRLSPEEYASLFYVFIQIEKLIDINLQSMEKVSDNSFVKLQGQERWYYVGDDEELDTTKITSKNETYHLFIDKNNGENIIFCNKYSSKKYINKIELIFNIEQYILWQSNQNFQKLSIEGRWEGARMIEVPQKDDTIDTKYLISFFQDQQKDSEPLFNMFCKGNVPLALLALSEGGLYRAVGRISQENLGYINSSCGSIADLEKQKSVAKKIIEGNLPFFIDGTSALFFSEFGIIEKIYNFIPNTKIPQSVIASLLKIAEKFRFSDKEKMSMGYVQGQLKFSSIEKEKSEFIQNKFSSSIKLLESNLDNIISISQANKINNIAEREMYPELCDACILARRENIPVLTEDYLYLQMNELETQKKAPEYFSSLILVRVLYEQNKISFNDYLEYFNYLSSYRFRFLSLSSDDIFKAVFGDGSIIKVRPEYIRKLNFPLTLAEDYGVTFQSSLNVIVTFLLRIIIDDTITSNIIERVYIEILSNYPSKMGKRDVGRIMLEMCRQIINNTHNIILSSTVQEKLDKLSNLTEIYNSGKQLWLPNQE